MALVTPYVRRKPAEPHQLFSFATVKIHKKGATLPSILEQHLQKPLRSQGCLCCQLGTLKRLLYVVTNVHMYIITYVFVHDCIIYVRYTIPQHKNHVASYIFWASHREI